MPRTVSVPAIQCYSYHPFQDSLASKSRSLDQVGSPDYSKAQLRNRLNSCRLSNMPAGFPFSYTHDGHGYSRLSYDSYEFREELTPSHRSHSRHNPHAVIAFKSPSPRDKNQYLTWQAYLPSPDAAYLRNSHKTQTVAQVQIDPSVTRTPFWASLMNDPSVILRALGISLELGVLLTIHLSDSRSGDVMYTITHKDGRQQPYFIVRH
ncbi:hypothetical protein FPV67DRAFT_1668757 [Lyophyllum atratum]|nr:hypothetical protein FPV67DRAFT_1668757 [Lyophyllum atratum]